jgi:hypothetical protein
VTNLRRIDGPKPRSIDRAPSTDDTARRALLLASIGQLADAQPPLVDADDLRLALLTERVGDVGAAYWRGMADIEGELQKLAATASSPGSRPSNGSVLGERWKQAEALRVPLRRPGGFRWSFPDRRPGRGAALHRVLLRLALGHLGHRGEVLRRADLMRRGACRTQGADRCEGIGVMTLSQPCAHPDAPAHHTFTHTHDGYPVHICSDVPARQELIDALLLAAVGLSTKSGCVDQGVSRDDRCRPDHRGSTAGPGGSHE